MNQPPDDPLERERLLLPADGVVDHAIVPIGGIVLLGYGKYCAEVEKQVDWFGALSDDQKWVSYQEYVNSAQRNARDLQAVIDGMQRDRAEYIAYLAEWTTTVGLEETVPERAVEVVEAAEVEREPSSLKVWIHAALFALLLLVTYGCCYLVLVFDVWTMLGGIALCLLLNVINVVHVHPSRPRRMEFAAYLTFGASVPGLGWLMGIGLHPCTGLFGFAVGVGVLVLCAFFAVAAVSERR